jgi:hypothetical protein
MVRLLDAMVENDNRLVEVVSGLETCDAEVPGLTVACEFAVPGRTGSLAGGGGGIVSDILFAFGFCSAERVGLGRTGSHFPTSRSVSISSEPSYAR